MNFISSTEVPVSPNPQPLVKPDTLFDGLLIAIPVFVSLASYGLKELIQYQVQRKTEEYKAETQRQKMEQLSKSDRIEYLEKQNEILLQEILSLRRMILREGSLSAEDIAYGSWVSYPLR